MQLQSSLDCIFDQPDINNYAVLFRIRKVLEKVTHVALLVLVMVVLVVVVKEMWTSEHFTAVFFILRHTEVLEAEEYHLGGE